MTYQEFLAKLLAYYTEAAQVGTPNVSEEAILNIGANQVQVGVGNLYMQFNVCDENGGGEIREYINGIRDEGYWFLVKDYQEAYNYLGKHAIFYI